MRKYIPIIFCCCFALLLLNPKWEFYHVHQTWTLTQVKGSTVATQSSAAVTVTSTGAGHLLVAGWVSGASTANPITLVTAAACTGSWTHAVNTSKGAPGDGSVDLQYCLNSASGQTAITITATSANAGSFGVIWEVSSSLGNIAVDSGAVPSQSQTLTTCTSCAGTSLTLSGNNDFVAALAACGGTCSAVTGTGYTNDLSNPSSDGVAHGLNITASGAAPATWTQTSSTQVNAAAAFQETSSGGAATGENRRQRMERLEE